MPGFKITGNEPESVMPSQPGKYLDWLRAHRFRINGFFGFTLNEENDYIYAVKEIKLPKKSIKELEIQGLGTSYKFPISAAYNDLELEFYGSQKLLSKLYEIQDRIHDNKNGIKNQTQFDDEVSIELYDGVKSDLVLYKYKQAWISEIDSDKVSYGSNEILSISVVIKFNYFVKLIYDTYNDTNSDK